MPFDNEQVLFDSLKSKLQSGDIIFIDKVLDECKYIGKKVTRIFVFFSIEKLVTFEKKYANNIANKWI